MKSMPLRRETEKRACETAARPKKRTHRLLFAFFAACGIFLLFATFGAAHAPTTATTSPSGTYAGGSQPRKHRPGRLPAQLWSRAENGAGDRPQSGGRGGEVPEHHALR